MTASIFSFSNFAGLLTVAFQYGGIVIFHYFSR